MFNSNSIMAPSNQHKFLKLYIPYDSATFANKKEYDLFIEQYKEHIQKHNDKIKNSVYKDAGFDLLMPCKKRVHYVPESPTTMLDLGVQCSMYSVLENESVVPMSYFLFPRSSTGSKTPFRLANSTGIIDSGYRGNIKTCIDYFYPNLRRDKNTGAAITPSYEFDRGQRLFQLCAGDLSPLIVSIVEHRDLLNIDNASTERGTGGFGSTNQRAPLRQRHLNENGMLVD